MTQRAQRFPTLNARLIRVEEGPPMYRMLGYADKNNVLVDLCDPVIVGTLGPFSTPRLPPNQTVPFGQGRFGLPQGPLGFTTSYWDDCAYSRCHEYVSRRSANRMYTNVQLPVDRPEARCFPEMAVPGTGVNSRCKDSGYLYVPGLPPPGVGYGR